MYKTKNLFIFLLILGFNEGQKYPDDGCFFDSPVVICNNLVLNDGDSLENLKPEYIFKDLVLYNFEGSLSSNTTLKYFPYIDHINIQNSVIESFDLGGHDLIELMVKNSKLPEISKSLLQNCCKDITDLSLRLEDTSISSDAFQDLPFLTYLAVTDGILENGQVISNAFNGSENIVFLKLVNLTISSIDEDAFKGLLNLKTLSIGVNMISTFENGTFQNLTKLNKLTIDERNVTSFDATVFNGLNIDCLEISLEFAQLLDYITLVNALPELHEVRVFIDEETDEDIRKVRSFCSWLVHVNAIHCDYSCRRPN